MTKDKESRAVPGSRPGQTIHEQITAKIVSAIEAGAGEWSMPWHRPGTSFAIPRNAVTGKNYRGSNVLSLWIDADKKKFGGRTWATFKQWQQIGAQVRKGEKGAPIVKYGTWTPKQQPGKSAPPTAAESDDAAERLYASPAWVFNADQVEGYQQPDTAPRPDLTKRLAHVDQFLANTGIQFREGGTRAFYRRRTSDGQGDYVQMPPRTLFTGTATSTPTEAYEATRLHEASHWTSDSKRCNRELGQRFGDEAYAMEELVAELSAAFLCAELQITNSPRPDHAQYLAHWLGVLTKDARAIFAAASHASRAADYLKGLQPVPADQPSEQAA